MIWYFFTTTVLVFSDLKPQAAKKNCYFINFSLFSAKNLGFGIPGWLFLIFE